MPWIRQAHRALSIVFTVLVVINIALNFAPELDQVALWVGLVTLVPLFLLMLSGLYLFVLPYLRRRSQ